MASIYKPAGSKKWRIAYKDASGQRVTTGGFRDKAATLAKARQLQTDAERQQAGIPVAQGAKLNQPLATTILQYQNDMNRRGLSSKHITGTIRAITNAAKHSNWHSLAEITAQAVTGWLATMTHQGGPRGGNASATVNHTHQAIHSIWQWAYRQNWTTSNPIAQLQHTKPQKVRLRRALTLQELEALLTATQATNPAAALAYRIAALTGFRRSDLARLQRRDIHLTETPPWVQFRSAATKSGRQDRVPLNPQAAEAIAAALAPRDDNPTTTLFAHLPKPQTYAKHAANAGIPRTDQEGRIADFHALRYFFCTAMSKFLPIQHVQQLMRHKTIALTANLYKDLNLTDLMQAKINLPTLALQKALTDDSANSSSTTTPTT